MKLTLLYRGSLSSCNYACDYCPFAKQGDDRAALAADQQALQRFVTWLTTTNQHRFTVFFTPWGEALIRRYYQSAIQQLSHTAHIDKVVIQTNLSCSLHWLAQVDLTRLRLWVTYHPSQVALDDFVGKCWDLYQRDVLFSVGTVGVTEQLAAIRALRQALPAEVYLWINALNDDPQQYDATQIAQFSAIDPLFEHNLPNYPSLGRYCHAGQHTLSVDGNGTLYRCHFIRNPLGNLYDAEFERYLQPRLCTNATCNCYIGYVHMPHLGLEQIYGEGLVERNPTLTIMI